MQARKDRDTSSHGVQKHRSNMSPRLSAKDLKLLIRIPSPFLALHLLGRVRAYSNSMEPKTQ